MIKRLLQGMVVGIANIIPGVSGGTMLVAMGAYDKLIYSLTHLFSQFKKSIKFLLPILLGAAIAIMALARIFEFLLETYPLPTNLGFSGLILGSLPAIYHPVRKKKITPSCMICCGVFFVLVCAMAMISEPVETEKALVFNLVNFIILFFIGIIAAATMVIPGVSGSMVLMLLGYYQPVLSLVNTFLDALKVLDWSLLLNTAGLLIPFGIGVVVGIFLIAKLIEWIFSRWRLQSTWAILGLIAASPIAILWNTSAENFSWLLLAAGAVAFFAGWFLTQAFAPKPKKKKKARHAAA